MKILSPQEFKVMADELLLKETRWNDSLDNDLWISCVCNVNDKVKTQGIRVREPVVIETDVDTGLECVLHVLYNPYAVMASALVVAMCVTDGVSAVLVLVDDKFMALSHSTQEFLIQHELGHIWHTHICVLGVRDDSVELEADMYAISKTSVDSAVVALSELRDSLKGPNYEAGRKELDKRISAIKCM